MRVSPTKMVNTVLSLTDAILLGRSTRRIVDLFSDLTDNSRNKGRLDAYFGRTRSGTKQQTGECTSAPPPSNLPQHAKSAPAQLPTTDAATAGLVHAAASSAAPVAIDAAPGAGEAGKEARATSLQPNIRVEVDLTAPERDDEIGGGDSQQWQPDFTSAPEGTTSTPEGTGPALERSYGSGGVNEELSCGALDSGGTGGGDGGWSDAVSEGSPPGSPCGTPCRHSDAWITLEDCANDWEAVPESDADGQDVPSGAQMNGQEAIPEAEADKCQAVVKAEELCQYSGAERAALVATEDLSLPLKAEPCDAAVVNRFVNEASHVSLEYMRRADYTHEQPTAHEKFPRLCAAQASESAFQCTEPQTPQPAVQQPSCSTAVGTMRSGGRSRKGTASRRTPPPTPGQASAEKTQGGGGRGIDPCGGRVMDDDAEALALDGVCLREQQVPYSLSRPCYAA